MSHLFRKITVWVGSTSGVFCGVGFLMIWIIAGFFVGFGPGYQLFGNTFMSAVSYVLLFVIQNSINHDAVALHAKINELILTNSKANNRLINVESLNEEQLLALMERYRKLSQIVDVGCVSDHNSARSAS